MLCGPERSGYTEERGMKKLAIIGASYLQEPLVEKAKAMGIETHVFAWQCGDVGEYSADFFYPISIVEKDEILEKCREIRIDGICSISSDLAAITVNYVANHMGLIGNSPECALVSTNKHEMRLCFERHGDPSPKSILVKSVQDLEGVPLRYPVIVKPTDRSGSRGITKLESAHGLEEAIERAKEQGFENAALVEEFAEGQEYSVECISWQGKHTMLAITKKYTTGAPHFVETGHLEPAPLDENMYRAVERTVYHALGSLGIAYGASHSELKISPEGVIRLIEIGGRMGGDFIGSDLVRLSTGFDFVKAVIQTALGIKPQVVKNTTAAAAVRFILSREDVDSLEQLKQEAPELLFASDVRQIENAEITESASRFGYFIFTAGNSKALEKYLPPERGD